MLLTEAYVFLCVLAFAWSKAPQYTYMVLVPRNIRPGTPLSMPVHFATPVTNECITATLFKTRRQLNGKDKVTILGETTMNVPNGATDEVIEMTVPPVISWGSYTVNITASGSVPFENSTTLHGRPKSMAIFVQTDKAMYKPGETVQYRIFAVNMTLGLIDPLMDIEFFAGDQTTYCLERENILYMDPKGNKIKEDVGVRNRLGVEGTLPLSELTPLGHWKISVNAKETDEKEDHYFEVKEYVLPKFEVTVTLPSYGKESDISLTGTAKAVYTFGKPVAGNMVLTVIKRYGSGFFDAKAVTTEMQLVNGEASFEIPMKVLKRLTRSMEYEDIVVIANVTETMTGITLDGEGEISYHRHPYKIKFFPNMADYFKPDFEPYKVWVKVMQQDDRPPESTATEEMKITVTYFTDKPVPGLESALPNYKVVSPFYNGDVIMENTTSHTLDKDGMVKFVLDIPNNTATATIKAEYADVNSYKEIRRFRSPTDTFLKAEIINDFNVNPLKIGDIVTVKLYSSAKAASVKYVILSRGQLINTGNTVIVNHEGVLEVALTRDMAPTSRLVVYYVRQDDEIVAEGINFVIEEIFENKVKIEFVQSSPQQPKTKVDLKVTADKDSLVNVLVVDRSVKLLAEGNDITQERIKTEMNEFGDSPWITRGWGPLMPWSFAAEDANDIFDNAQLRVLTDADLYRFDLWSLRLGGFRTGSFTCTARKVYVSPAKQGQGQIRKYFPETWIWKSKTVVNGVAVFPDVVPDTITTFVANAFAVNTETGLGVAPSTADMGVFLPFFINLQLPYSVVRNEVAVLQVNVFNYRNQDHNVLVTLRGSDEFVIVTVGADNSIKTVTGDITKCVLVKKDQPTPVFFNVKPLKKGNPMFIVRADISQPKAMFDEVRRPLRVKAEGVEKENNIPILVSSQTKCSVVEGRDLTYPPSLVPDSERTRVTVFGDFFGPSLENLDRLIKMPYGCGEQNMVNFGAAVSAVVYMRETGRFDSDQKLKSKIKNVLTKGYQRQLLYQRRDGSFSAFGDADDVGSLWLTAFVAKSLAQAHSVNVVFIDPNVIAKAVKFIFRHQFPDGTLDNVGIVSHKALQGVTTATENAYVLAALQEVKQADILRVANTASDNSIMAYVLAALQDVKQADILRDVNATRKLDGAIVKLTDALVFKIPKMTTDYERAIGAYALKLVNNKAYTTLLSELESSPDNVIEGNKRYWKNPSRALQIEIASYALSTYASIGDKGKGLSVLMWLIDSRNPYGGFVSTQDTVVALRAFAKFATLVYTKDVNMLIDIYTKTGGVQENRKQIKLNAKNHDVLQYIEFKGKVDQVVVDAKGTGLALININQFYNVESDEGQAYELRVTTSEESSVRYTVTACARYNIPKSRSNMAIMDIGAVSGFEPIKEQVTNLPLIKRKEISGGRLVIYFDEIPDKEVCVSVPMQRVAVVASVAPANAIVYSYYDPSERLMNDYLPGILSEKHTSLCKACDNVCCDTKNVLDIEAC